MFIRVVLNVLANVSTFVFAAVLKPTPLPSLNIPSNLTLIGDRIGDLSASNKLQIQCNAPEYGRNLKIPSCKKIFGLVAKEDKQLTFADRHSIIPHNISLPYRLQSRE